MTAAGRSSSPPTGPRDLQALEDRLRERFQAGLVADIAAARLRHAHGDPAQACTQRRHRPGRRTRPHRDRRACQSNVRALEGALIRTVAFSSLTGRQLTGDLARRSSTASTRRSAEPGDASAPSARSRRRPASTSASARRSSSPQHALPASHGRDRSPCISRASSPTSRCRRSAVTSEAGTTRQSFTPAGAQARRSPPMRKPRGCGEAVQRPRLRPSMSRCRATTDAPDRLPPGVSTAVHRRVHRSMPSQATIHHEYTSPQVLLMTCSLNTAD